jgi:hypothetical protein
LLTLSCQPYYTSPEQAEIIFVSGFSYMH